MQDILNLPHGYSCIALNLIKNYYGEKKKGTIFSSFDNDLENTLFFCPEDVYIQNELVCKTLNEIENLTEENRQMFKIMLEEGSSYQDVAQVMKIPIGTIRSRLSRSRAVIKNKML